MKFVSLANSVLGKTQRAVSQASSVMQEDLKDPAKLAETLRQMTARLNRLEAAQQPEGTEFDVVLTDGGALVEMAHGFKTTAVRWTVVGWFAPQNALSPSIAPSLVYDGSSTATSLFLRSYVKGRAIIRVEPAQGFLDATLPADITGAPLARTTARAQYADTATHVLISIPVPANSTGTWRVTVISQDTVTIASRCIVSWMMHARNDAGTVSDLVNVVSLATATANYSTASVIAGTNVNITAACTVAGPRTVNWTAIVEPVLLYLRDEP